jgi:lipid-A-disaccharide synthase
LKLFITALEPSSNLHLSYLLKELPDVELMGIYDEKFGGNPLYTPKDFSIMGFVDVFKKGMGRG